MYNYSVTNDSLLTDNIVHYFYTTFTFYTTLNVKTTCKNKLTRLI